MDKDSMKELTCLSILQMTVKLAPLEMDVPAVCGNYPSRSTPPYERYLYSTASTATPRLTMPSTKRTGQKFRQTWKEIHVNTNVDFWLRKMISVWQWGRYIFCECPMGWVTHPQNAKVATIQSHGTSKGNSTMMSLPEKNMEAIKYFIISQVSRSGGDRCSTCKSCSSGVPLAKRSYGQHQITPPGMACIQDSCWDEIKTLMLWNIAMIVDGFLFCTGIWWKLHRRSGSRPIQSYRCWEHWDERKRRTLWIFPSACKPHGSHCRFPGRRCNSGSCILCFGADLLALRNSPQGHIQIRNFIKHAGHRHQELQNVAVGISRADATTFTFRRLFIFDQMGGKPQRADGHRQDGPRLERYLAGVECYRFYLCRRTLLTDLAGTVFIIKITQ